jgi:GT2 family glycosyltransferase
MTRAHAIISTHTTRHLRPTLLGVLAQSRRPDSVVVSADSDDPEIAVLVQALATERSFPITLVQRPHQGESRSSQVRNNAVRAVVSSQHAPADVLWFLDGDCLPAPDCLEQHLRSYAGSARPVVVAFRVDLTRAQTEAIDESRIARGEPLNPTQEQLAALQARERRYRRHLLLRRLGIGKPHKPKLLSANFSVRIADFLAVNGFDEEYTGYGQEDDDLGRRLYKIGAAPVLAIIQAMAFHLYHETRAPGEWEASPNAARFARPFSERCVHGVTNPAPQPAPVITRFPLASAPVSR